MHTTSLEWIFKVWNPSLTKHYIQMLVFLKKQSELDQTVCLKILCTILAWLSCAEFNVWVSVNNPLVIDACVYPVDHYIQNIVHERVQTWVISRCIILHVLLSFLQTT